MNQRIQNAIPTHLGSHATKRSVLDIPVVLTIVVTLIFAMVLALLICLTVPSQKAYAANTMEDNPLRVEIQYDEPILTGQVTTFKLIGSGGDGNYQYRPVSLSVWHEGYYQQIVDFSYVQFKPIDTFEYTFTYSGKYEMKFQVFGKNPENDMFTYNFGTTRFTIDDPSAPSLDDRKQQAEAKADEVWAQCQVEGCKTDYDKALWLHDWIINHAEYDNTSTHYQAYDIFVEGKGTCEAYHGAYTMLLNRAGIPCGRVEGGNHVWTSVQLGGKWYYVDTTHDDPEGNDWYGLGEDEKHLQFAINDEIKGDVMALNDQGIERKTPDISATSWDDNYFIKSGRIKHYSDGFVSDIQSNLDAGKSSFSLDVPLTLDGGKYALCDKDKVILYSLAAYDLENRSWNSGGKSKSLNAYYEDGKIVFSVKDASQQSIPMYRLYNRVTGEHLYTASAYERDVLARGDWNYEGIGWYAPTTGAPVYRLWNGNVGEHHYTTSTYERDYIVKYQGWTYEGIGWYSAGNTPLYRLYNPDWNMHHYTTSTYERDYISRYQGWNKEGIGWYGL